MRCSKWAAWVRRAAETWQQTWQSCYIGAHGTLTSDATGSAHSYWLRYVLTAFARVVWMACPHLL